MGTWRRPKGSYVRPTADFFIDRCAIGGVFYQSTAGKVPAIELFNNATDGTQLHIYKLWIQNDGGYFYIVTRQTGTMGGTTVPVYPVIAYGGVPPGIISYADVDSFTYPIPAPFGVGAFIAGNNEAGTLDDFSAPGPICVLAPQTSLRVRWGEQGPSRPGNLAVTFYYAALPDQG
jgi:hypothetical protein